MNSFSGHIAHIQTSGSLSLVQIQVGAVLFKTILIETPETASYLKENHLIQVIFKETEVVIAKGIQPAISMQNQIGGTILDIESDVLLSKVTLQTAIGHLKAIITTGAVAQLQLEVGDTVLALIKTNELMVSE